MVLIGEEDAAEIRKRLAELANPVRLIHFTQELNVAYASEAKQLLEELAALSPKLALQVYNFVLDKERGAEYGVDKVPATIVRNSKDYGIRFYGLPAGYEFAMLLDAILAVSKGESGLAAETREKLSKIARPVHLEVLVTPT
jgi:glutaredoxin-like protein